MNLDDDTGKMKIQNNLLFDHVYFKNIKHHLVGILTDNFSFVASSNDSLTDDDDVEGLRK
jgi:hypothetical protein